ncbi:MAG: methyltransferase, partial [Motiliproteus sp.]|nr:methyltransferase [Motiliproteus sp.]
MDLMNVPQGQFQLQRYPAKSHPSLRAWDAADELILQHLEEIATELAEDPKVWIFNDSFGALTTALSQWAPRCSSDSYLAFQGLINNSQLNNQSFDPGRFIPATEQPSGAVDIVLIKIPKTLALLEHQLCQLKPLLTAETKVIGAGMAKQIHRSTLDLFERILGATNTSLARKKARLVFTQVNSDITETQSPYPSSYELAEYNLTLSNHANVFCRDRLDIGTRLLLQHLPTDANYGDIVDLGCGNGVVGLVAAQRNPDANLHFVDESYMAVASAKDNWQQLFGGSPRGHFQVSNCLDDFGQESADLVLNNPPFHQQQVIGDHIAWQMFKQSYSCLRTGGELWVIGNRHLGYH